MVPGPILPLCESSGCIPEYPSGLGGASSSLILSTDSLLRCRVLANDGSQELDLAQSAVGELHSLTDWQVSEASEEAELVDFWLVMSEGMGDGGLEWVLASWETKPESWEETLLSRWAPAEGIWRRLHILLFLELVLLGEEGGVW